VKNYENRATVAEIIIKIKEAHFFETQSTCICRRFA